MHPLGLLLGVFLATADDAGTVQLRASASQPYIGQEITLSLELDVPSTSPGPLELSIPWRTREFGFSWSMPPAEWLRERAAAKEGLAIQVSSEKTIIRAEPWPPAPGSTRRRHRLQWRLVVNEPDTLHRGPMVFAPVRLKLGQTEVVSNSVMLERRKLPLMPAEMPQLFLGVGDFQLQVEPPKRATMNEPAPLTVRVTSNRVLARVPQPAPRELWNEAASADFRLEPLKALLNREGGRSSTSCTRGAVRG